VSLANAASTPPGVRPPVQARSRKALQKVLAAAEDVLAADGFDEFTMTAVAERAGVSVGAIYRRFEGREQLLAAVKDRLLSRLEEDLAERLSSADPSLEGVVNAFASAIADAFVAGGPAWPDLLRSTGKSLQERGREALESVRQLFEQASGTYRDQVRRSDPAASLAAVERMITGALIHQATMKSSSHDNIPMQAYARQLSDMAIAYLLTPDDGCASPRGAPGRHLA
jgi:AcrR family transcriptional regulator